MKRIEHIEEIDRFAFIQELDFFKNVAPEYLWEIAKNSFIYEFDGLIIAKEDKDATDFLLIIYDGNVIISKLGQNIGILQKGDLFGLEEILLEKTQYTNSLIKTSDRLQILRIPKRAIGSLLIQSNDFAVNSVKSLATEIESIRLKLSVQLERNQDLDTVLQRLNIVSNHLQNQIDEIGASEIERKFLLSKDFDINILNSLNIKHEIIEIIQAYTIVEKESERRIRKYGKGYFETTKKGTGKTRHEIESIISEEEFKNEFKKIKGKPILKTRYKINDSRFKEFIIDIYKKEFEPLKVLELEFISNEDSVNFEYPKWIESFIIKEITEDSDFKNKNLFLDGKPKL